MKTCVLSLERHTVKFSHEFKPEIEKRTTHSVPKTA